MSNLFNLINPPYILQKIKKAIVFYGEEAEKWEVDIVLKRLRDFEIDFIFVEDINSYWQARNKYKEYQKNCIFIGRHHPTSKETINIIENIAPQILIWIKTTSEFQVTWRKLQETKLAIDGITFPFSIFSIPLERKFLYYLAKNLRGPGVILEIGAHAGGTTLPLAIGNKKNLCPTRLFTIDKSFHKDFYFYINQFNLNNEISYFEIPSKELIKIWQKVSTPYGGPKLRLLWIDGDHSYEGVKNDLINFLPYVVSGGVVVLHDYGSEDGIHQGIMRAVWEKLYTNPDFYDFTIVGSIFYAQKKGGERFLKVNSNLNSPSYVLKWLNQFLPYQNKKILLYGGGQHTKDLLTLAQGGCKDFFDSIIGIIDQNPKCLCSSLFSFPIYAPEEIPDLKFDFIIPSTYDYEAQIIKHLEEIKIPKEKIIPVYMGEDYQKFAKEHVVIRNIRDEKQLEALIK